MSPEENCDFPDSFAAFLDLRILATKPGECDRCVGIIQSSLYIILVMKFFHMLFAIDRQWLP